METREKDLSELIPDYCNDQMDADARAEFERVLEKDSALLDEVNDFREFQSLYREADPVEPPPSAALFEQICQRAGVEQKVEKRQTASGPSLVDTIKGYWERIREYTTVPWAFAAVQMAVIVLLLMPATEQQNTYQTLSATQAVESSEAVRINVVFQPKAMESDIRELLYSVQGSVTSGPSKGGRYVISFAKDSDLQKTLETLQQAEIVLFAEPHS